MATLIDSYSETNYDGASDLLIRSDSNGSNGQSFTVTDALNLDSCKFYARKSTSGAGTVVARLYTHSGTYGTSSVGGTLLATSDGVDLSTFGTSYGLITFTFSGANQVSLTASTYYVIMLEMETRPVVPELCQVGGDSSSPSHGGNTIYGLYGTPSNSLNSCDTCFYVYGTEVVTTTSTSSSTSTTTTSTSTSSTTTSTSITTTSTSITTTSTSTTTTSTSTSTSTSSSTSTSTTTTSTSTTTTSTTTTVDYFGQVLW